jgi:hypothetical protein
MKKLALLFFGILSIVHAFAQKMDQIKVADSIKNEGMALYKSEWASWYGTDIFVEKCKARREVAGGYISYDSGEGLVNIFFSKESQPKVLSTITFGYDFNSKQYSLDTTDRYFSIREKELYTIRQNAIAQMSKDTLFKTYKNTSLNPVPLIQNGIKKVYVLTGATNTGVVLFGNDYLLSFDNENHISSEKKLHKGLIAIGFKSAADTPNLVLASIHTHLPEYNEFITATDICTLMLYEGFTTWNQHIVISKNYVSIWDCKQNNLAILTSEAWKKMNPAKDALENNSH